jgi:hypothetical protein
MAKITYWENGVKITKDASEMDLHGEIPSAGSQIWGRRNTLDSGLKRNKRR